MNLHFALLRENQVNSGLFQKLQIQFKLPKTDWQTYIPQTYSVRYALPRAGALTLCSPDHRFPHLASGRDSICITLPTPDEGAPAPWLVQHHRTP